MAIWQFRVVLLPEKEVRGIYGELPQTITENMADEHRWWKETRPPAGFEKWIDEILPTTSSWSKDMLMWGCRRVGTYSDHFDKNSDTASVIYADEKKDRVEHIDFGVDVTQLPHSLIEKICAFASRIECVFVTRPHNLVFLPELSEFLKAIEGSPARRFIHDPEATLKGLDRQGYFQEVEVDEPKRKSPAWVAHARSWFKQLRSRTGSRE